MELRIRLKFHDPHVLTYQQIKQGLAQSWFLLRLDNVHTIYDVEFDIIAAFHLEDACPHGLVLEVDGFVLPASQPALLLKESDIVSIKRRRYLQPGLLFSQDARNDHRKVINSDGYAEFCGVELRAPEEFDKETGGYQSEEEEGEMETDISLDERVETPGELRKAPLSLKESSRGGKKRKRLKDIVAEMSIRAKDVGYGQELAATKNKSKDVFGRGELHEAVVLHALDDKEIKEPENGGERKEEEKNPSKRGKRSAVKRQTADVGIPIEQDASEKKRKKVKNVTSELQGEVPQNERGLSNDGGVGQCIGDLAMDSQQKTKRKRANDSGSHSVSANVTLIDVVQKEPLKVVEVAAGHELRKLKTSRKEKKVSEGNHAGINGDDSVREKKSKKEKVVDNVKLKRTKEPQVESVAEKLRMPDGDVNGGSTPPSAWKDESKQPQLDRTHKSSRSARRKKAKRLWIREQAKMAPLPSIDTHPLQSKGSDMPVTLGPEEPERSSPVGENIEAEAEEEVLPIVVRAGHIRFEPYDTDKTPDQHPPPLPMLGIDQFKSKRQGQTWGQEKTSERRKGARQSTRILGFVSPEVDIGDTRVTLHSDPANFEKLAPLDGAPQEGDVLAYRLVELTASWTPELSPYRVGLVVQWEYTTNVIKLDPHPDHPFLLREDEDLDGMQEKDVVAPYDEHKSLKTDFSTLVDVRLLQRRHRADNVVVTDIEIREESCAIRTEGHHVGNSDNSAVQPVIGGIDIRASMIESKDGDNESTLGSTLSLADLISQALEKKKEELLQKLGATEVEVKENLVSPEQMGPENSRSLTVDSEGNQPLKKTRKGKKSKYLRSAGVGSIVALLRAQQVL